MNAREQQEVKGELALLDDRPKNGIDQDEFGREEFVSRLAKLLNRPPMAPSLIVSLEEDFGFGKTSALNFVKEQLNLSCTHPPVVIEFNPWIISGSSNLIESFLFQVGASLSTKEPKNQQLKTIGKKLSAYSSVFSALKLVPGAEPWSSIAKTVFESVGESSFKIGKLEDYSIDKHREEIQKAIRSANRPIIVIIDDLDRLTPKEVCQMIQVVKVVSDFDGITYLLAYEHDYLKHALSKLGVKQPDAYLEKIVQFRVSLPKIRSNQLEAILLKELKQVSGTRTTWNNESNQSDVLALLFDPQHPLIRNLRDIKRLINSLNFLGDVVLRDVGLWNLIGLEAIRLRAPEIWDLIKRHQTRVTIDGTKHAQIQWVSKAAKISNKIDDDKAAIEARFKKALIACEGEGEVIRDLLKQLFPSSECLSRQGKSRKFRTGQVCFNENLARYFYFGAGQSDIANEEYFQFLQNVDRRAGILSKVDNSVKLLHFLSGLIEVVADVSMEQVGEGLVDLAKKVDSVGFGDDFDAQFGLWEEDTFDKLCRFIQELFIHHGIEKVDLAHTMQPRSPILLRVLLLLTNSGSLASIKKMHFNPSLRNALKKECTVECCDKVFEEVSRALRDGKPRHYSSWRLIRVYGKKKPASLRKLIKSFLEEGQILSALWLVAKPGANGDRPIILIPDNELDEFGGREQFQEVFHKSAISGSSLIDKALLHSFEHKHECYVDNLEQPDPPLYDISS